MNTQLKTLIAILACTSALCACGGGSDDSSTPAAAATPAEPVTMLAGQKVTLGDGQSVKVPASTTVVDSDNNITSIDGESNTVTVQAGAVVSVPDSATGPANNLVKAVAEKATPAVPTATPK
jgi:hypothetical protein